MNALNKGSDLDNSSLEQEFAAAGAGWRKGKGNAVKGALTPLLGQAAVTRIPVSGQDYSYKSKQLHPLQRGEDMEPFPSLLLLKSSLPCQWHCSCETGDSFLQCMQHHVQDVSWLAVEICSKSVTPTLPPCLWVLTLNELTYSHTSIWRNHSPFHQTHPQASEPLQRHQKSQNRAVCIEQQISLEQMLGKKMLLHFCFLWCLRMVSV